MQLCDNSICLKLTLDDGEHDIIISEVLSECACFLLLLEDLRLLRPSLLRQILHLNIILNLFH